MAKHVGFGALLEVEMWKKCTPLWREAHFQVKSGKTHHFGRLYFWKLRCGKSARRCGAKHIWKSKVAKHVRFGRLLDVADVEKVHAVVARSTFRSQKWQNTWVRTTFGRCDVEKVHAVVARSTFRSKKCQNTWGSDHFWTFAMSKKCTPLWREAHFEVKSGKTRGVRTTF